MTPRIKAPLKHVPQAMKAMIALEASLKDSGLEPLLLELVKMRASQINGCAFCIDMHVTEARKLGESDMRLHMLNAWRESSLFSARERAALAWTEALTRVADTHAPDADYAPLEDVFSEDEIVNLSLGIGAINLWNRLQIGFQAIPTSELQHAAA